MDIGKVREAKGLLKKYERQMKEAQAMAISSELGLRGIEQLIGQKSVKIEEEAKRKIAENAFVTIRNIENTDPDAARKLADEIRDLIEEPPTDEQMKRGILAELDRMFPDEHAEEDEPEGSEENKETEEERPPAEPAPIEKIKALVEEGGSFAEHKDFSRGWMKANQALGLAEKLEAGENKERVLDSIYMLKDLCSKELANKYLEFANRLGQVNKELAQSKLKQAKDKIDDIHSEVLKSEAEVNYATTVKSLEGYVEAEDAKAGEKEEPESAAGEEEGEKEKAEAEMPERKVPVDVKELMDKDIFMSEARLEDALKLATNDAADKEGLKAFSKELDKAMEDTVADVKRLIVSAGADENKVEGIKKSVIDRLSGIYDIIDDRIKSVSSTDRDVVYIKMELPKNDEQRKVYFLMKLQKVLDRISEQIKRL